MEAPRAPPKLSAASIAFIGNSDKLPFVAFNVELGAYPAMGKTPLARLECTGADELWRGDSLYGYRMTVCESDLALTDTSTVYVALSMSARDGGEVVSEYRSHSFTTGQFVTALSEKSSVTGVP